MCLWPWRPLCSFFSHQSRQKKGPGTTPVSVVGPRVGGHVGSGAEKHGTCICAALHATGTGCLQEDCMYVVLPALVAAGEHSVFSSHFDKSVWATNPTQNTSVVHSALQIATSLPSSFVAPVPVLLCTLRLLPAQFIEGKSFQHSVSRSMIGCGGVGAKVVQTTIGPTAPSRP